MSFSIRVIRAAGNDNDMATGWRNSTRLAGSCTVYHQGWWTFFWFRVTGCDRWESVLLKKIWPSIDIIHLKWVVHDCWYPFWWKSCIFRWWFSDHGTHVFSAGARSKLLQGMRSELFCILLEILYELFGKDSQGACSEWDLHLWSTRGWRFLAEDLRFYQEIGQSSLGRPLGKP